MGTVSVSQLKAHLAKHLRAVKRGGEVQILDRGVPVARLVPVQGSSEKSSARRNRLVRSGVLLAGDGNVGALLDKPPLDVGTSISQALHEERNDRL